MANVSEQKQVKPPRNLKEVLERNRELVASAREGVRSIYRMNRDYEARHK